MTSDINNGSKMLVMAPNLVSDYIDDRKNPCFHYLAESINHLIVQDGDYLHALGSMVLNSA